MFQVAAAGMPVPKAQTKAVTNPDPADPAFAGIMAQAGGLVPLPPSGPGAPEAPGEIAPETAEKAGPVEGSGTRTEGSPEPAKREEPGGAPAPLAPAQGQESAGPVPPGEPLIPGPQGAAQAVVAGLAPQVAAVAGTLAPQTPEGVSASALQGPNMLAGGLGAPMAAGAGMLEMPPPAPSPTTPEALPPGTLFPMPEPKVNPGPPPILVPLPTENAAFTPLAASPATEPRVPAQGVPAAPDPPVDGTPPKHGRALQALRLLEDPGRAAPDPAQVPAPGSEEPPSQGSTWVQERGAAPPSETAPPPANPDLSAAAPGTRPPPPPAHPDLSTTSPRAPADSAESEPANAPGQAAPRMPASPGPGLLPRAESLGVQVSAAPAASLSAPDPSPPTGVPPPVPHPPPSLFQQVEGGVRWMIRNSIQGADLQLHPESLGRVRIVLQVEGQDVRARLWVSDPKSIPVLMQHKGILEVSLQEQGLNLGGFDLQQQANPHPRPWTQPDSNRTWPTEAVPGPPRQDSPNPAPARRGRPRGIELLA